MAAKDFDYENFAQNLAGQAQGLVPQDFTDEQKQYVKDKIKICKNKLINIYYSNYCRMVFP